MELGETEKLQRGNTEFTLQSRWDRFALSVRPKSYERETESLQSHLGETEIPIGETEKTRVLWQWLCQLNSVAPDRKFRWV